MELYEGIITRHSERVFNSGIVPDDLLLKLIEAGIRAPSGKNGQPWRFRIVNNHEQIEKISLLSRNYPWMRKAGAIIVVFLCKNNSYNYVKDVQSCGAAMQNISLAATSFGLGSCWIGDNLDKSEQIKEALGLISENLEYMGIIVMGYVNSTPKVTPRNGLNHFLV